MKLIDKERFLQYKKSDTLVIWGSGSSIKDLKKEDFEPLGIMELLTAQRQNGLGNLIDRLITLAKAK